MTIGLLRQIDESAVQPALHLLPQAMGGPQVRIQLLAIGLQETGLRSRVQRLSGPARGLLQFERGGGVKGVLEYHSTAAIARDVCVSRCVTPDQRSAWEVMESDDVLCMAFGRLLLWTDPERIPGDAEGAWQMYLRTWRPGKPHPESWPAFHRRAVAWVRGGIDS